MPEVASRQHVLEIVPTVEAGLGRADLTWSDIDAIAVTHGPGLAGALLVGVNAAKALALGAGLPLIGVNHLEGHIYANWLEGADPESEPGFPLLCLIASGGHTDLILMEDHGRYSLLGRTRDDAAGEAFDKAARILGLVFQAAGGAAGLPGRHRRRDAPSRLAEGVARLQFQRPQNGPSAQGQEKGLYPPDEDSGPDPHLVRELAAAFQLSVADVMTTKTLNAARKHNVRGIMLGGGVAANSMLRSMLREKSHLPLFIPSPALCTDNGAMIAACGYFQQQRVGGNGWDLDVEPGLKLG